MSYRRRRSPLEFIFRTVHQFAGAVGQLLYAACVPFLMLADLWSSLLHNGGRSLRQVGRVNWLRLLLSYIRLPFFELLRASRWMFASVIGWWPRARLIHLLQGSPAILILLLTGLPLVIANGKEASRYAIAATEAERDRDFEKAELYFRAIAENDPNNEDFRYRLALSAEALGDHERARAIMTSLASPKQQGYPFAHFWLAEQLLYSNRSTEAVAEAEAHLKRAIQGAPNFAEAHQELGVRYLAAMRLDEAEPHLLKAAEVRPELWINVARLRVLQGRREQAIVDAEKALDYYRTRAEGNLDDVQSRLFWAESLVFLERFNAAATVLLDGAKLSSDSRFPQAISRVYLMWAEVLRARQGASSPAQQQVLLVRSFQFNPKNPLLLRRLMRGLRENGDDSALVRSVLRALLGRGQELAIIDLLLAVDADTRNQTSAADNYLAKARAIDPKITALASELAVSFVEIDPPLTEDAYYLVNLGLRAWVNDADLRFARGFLYYRRGLWIESLIDLQAALPKKTESANMHRLLADVYQKLGMREKAEAHLERITAAR
ncbi:MAG TPA: hypothetical protein VHV55_16325 [Pirellulales bacterium]|jgi:tetratricopeptide (TPR) repeat protein|nr:hypothetical protein [Pirellulales bacterium]